MFVKICGITRPEDAETAVALGANAIGFVFWPSSPRCVTPERARSIVERLPDGVAAVGVFVDEQVDAVNEMASKVGLRAVQLHGGEPREYAERISVPVIKALTLADDDAGWPLETMILLDAHDPVRRGGTGRTIDWRAAAAIAARRRTLLAGGLTPDNVAEAIAQVRPFGIDVSSGVETSPGVKDHQRLAALFEAVHDVEA